MNDELEKLLAEATPLPWAIDDLDPGVVISVHESQYMNALNSYSVTSIGGAHNAALIVAAVNALPEMLAERDRLREISEVHRETLGLLLPVLPHLIGKSVPPDFEEKLNALVLRARAALNQETKP